MSFEHFGLIEPLLRAVCAEGYLHPTPVQREAIPHVLKGRDLLGCAQTGTGKTAAFALPILQRLYKNPLPATGRRPIRALVLTPTRELAAQVDDSFGTYGRHTKLHHAVVYGGVRQGPQTRALRAGVDILTATPGRLLDLMQQGLVDFRALEVLVLDEADRMLDMGFIEDVRRIISKLPAHRQTLLFSATMPPSIQALANSVLYEPIEVRVAQEKPAASTVEQAVYLVEQPNKQSLLEHLLRDPAITRVLVFTRTRHGADRVTSRLNRAGIPADAIHSDKTQSDREQALGKFKSGSTRVLVASDLAARGLDVDDISHVINFDLPAEPGTYIHRIGRTGRAGAGGEAWSFCSFEERSLLDQIERLVRSKLRVADSNPYAAPLPRVADKATDPAFAHARARALMRRTGGRRR